MPRKKTVTPRRENLVQTAFRLAPEALAGLDELIARINAENPMGRRLSRSDVVQECVAYGVKHWRAFGSPIAAPDDSAPDRAA